MRVKSRCKADEMAALLLDLGNSRLKGGVWDGHTLTAVQAFPHPATGQAWPLPTPWRAAALGGIHLASVAGSGLTQCLQSQCQHTLGISPRQLKTTPAALGVRNGYREPQRLGIDRWLAILAAFQQHGGPLVVADMGSAVTLDLVTPAGQHLGGSIIPGLALMARSLTERISLPIVEDWDQTYFPGNNTQSGIATGAVEAVAGLVERATRWLEARYGPAILVLTGGDAPMVAPALAGHPRWIPHLVLEGMGMLIDVEIPLGSCELSDSQQLAETA
ncbi:MAG: type III pantothenate kinase [Pseudomonadota bacterium]